ncbi:CCHC-type zinc finger transcription factor, partial [Phycomyces blakesleeanus NRRL 1555(-)]
CFGCRKTGHSVGNCPEAKQSGQDELPFAKCFVCKAQGHLSGQCPENSKGLYPNGGGCRFCGKVDHLAKDC